MRVCGGPVSGGAVRENGAYTEVIEIEDGLITAWNMLWNRTTGETIELWKVGSVVPNLSEHFWLIWILTWETVGEVWLVQYINKYTMGTMTRMLSHDQNQIIELIHLTSDCRSLRIQDLCRSSYFCLNCQGQVQIISRSAKSRLLTESNSLQSITEHLPAIRHRQTIAFA